MAGPPGGDARQTPQPAAQGENAIDNLAKRWRIAALSFKASAQARRRRLEEAPSMRIEPAFLFDLDGTLVDSVYQHVLAWKEALDSEGVEISVWRIHRKIGMSGGLFTNQLRRETGVDLGEERLERLRRLHVEAYRRMSGAIRPLPGARELLAFLTNAGLKWAIATSGRMETASVNLKALGVDPARTPVVTRDQVKYAKPDPDLFLAAAARLNAPIETAVVVGDSIWDMLAAARCRALGVGLLCGGYGASELQQATAFRVYEDPADLLVHIDELGGRR
jgi:HAD superfamily hydrolase (TIGR01509 family)